MNKAFFTEEKETNMALTRKFLGTMGIEEDKIEEIIKAHLETVNPIKEERDKYKADAESLPTVQKELDELKAKMADSGEDALKALKAKYDKLDKEFKDYKSDVTAKETRANKESAKKALLKEAGIAEKYIDIIMKASSDDVDGLVFEEDGKTIKDADKIKEGYKTTYADFIVKKEAQGATVTNPPSSNGGSTAPSRAAELFKKHSENLYGKAKED